MPQTTMKTYKTKKDKEKAKLEQEIRAEWKYGNWVARVCLSGRYISKQAGNCQWTEESQEI